MPADLVVLGSQGCRGLPRMVLGSVAERVVRMATVPVLTVHPSDHVAILAGGMDRFRHVLAPTDFSEASRRGVDTATELAAQLDAALTVVHVQPQPSFHVPPDVLAAADAQARGLLEELLGRVRARCAKAEGVLKRGTPWECVLDVARDRGADLVVLSTHGRRGLPRVFMGSVAEKIVRLAHVPVVTVGAAWSQSAGASTAASALPPAPASAGLASPPPSPGAPSPPASGGAASPPSSALHSVPASYAANARTHGSAAPCAMSGVSGA